MARPTELARVCACAKRESVTMKLNRVLFQVVLLVITFCGAAWAQNGSITGTVKDPSGATIPGAATERQLHALISNPHFH